ncbi:LptF/LptG family permease [Campylobacter sp. 19-13652]|uniref:LptF/LptG family permease n=1 Tax=Campylobacter sp. 19-13652 TaxID=2840180 RepID=UPI001C754EB6|nr:LptF/LptG family permease [Campylobacter sp. 19-13652]BCX78815.1 membrane protein [Campylobacter sp. 19-13652]
MNKIYIRFISSVYLKYFFIIFAALELFYVGIDVLTNLKDLPTSANLQLLYACLLALSAASYTLPLSLIFALIVSSINLIRSNELVSFYALGVSRHAFIAPPFFIAFFITAIFIGLNFTPFAYAQTYQRDLIKSGGISQSTSSDVFLKFDGRFIYIKSLNQAKKSMQNVRIFELDGINLKSFLTSNEAMFKNNKWQLKDPIITMLPENMQLGSTSFSVKKEQSLEALSGFSPKSIEQASQAQSAMSGADALEFMFTFKDEEVSLEGIRASFYMLVFTPLYAPLLVFIFYCHMPIIGRFLNLAMASFVMVVATFVVWGVIFILARFALNGILNPEIALLSPVALLLIYSIYLWRRLA